MTIPACCTLADGVESKKSPYPCPTHPSYAVPMPDGLSPRNGSSRERVSDTVRIKDLPRVDRPREKLEKYGPERLSNSELLALVLRTGSKGMNALGLSRKILSKFSSGGLATAGVGELQNTFGLGRAKACEIVACFELGRRLLQNKEAALFLSPKTVWEELRDIRDNKREHMVVFFLDAKNQEIKREIVSVGTLSVNLAHPREVFEPAVRYTAAQVLVAHNHPSGSLEPSAEDVTVTRELVSAGKILGIDLIDHVIVTASEFFSFKEAGLIE